MLEKKTRIRIVGHVLERGFIFKLSEEIKDINVEVMHVDVSFASLKAGVEEKMPSVMRFYLVGTDENRKDALEKIERIAKKAGCAIDTISEKVD